MPKNCIFTIIAPNYIGQALTLMESVKSFDKDFDFRIVIVTDKKIEYDPTINPYIVYASTLEIIDYEKICFSYNILEHCTNIKPAAIKFFIKNYDYVYYIDPDIYFYSSPIVLNKLFEDKDILLTPHSLTPILDEFKPTELEFLRTGVFNLGFIGVKKSNRVNAFLDWWAVRCEKFGINETNSGLFVDQKWMDLAPCFFDFIKILRHPGVNVGYWNIHERVISFDGKNYFSSDYPLLFFHFSGLDPHKFERVSKHQSRLLLTESMILFWIFKNYSEKLIFNSQKFISINSLPYNKFDNDVLITELARKYFWKNSNKYSSKDIFSHKNILYSDCKRHRLLQRFSSENVYFNSHADYSKYSFLIRIFEFSLFIFLMIIGPVRFFNFKKYLIQRFSVISIFYKW